MDVGTLVGTERGLWELSGGALQPVEEFAGREVTALNDNLLVRIDETATINHLTPRADFRFAVQPTKTNLRLGDAQAKLQEVNMNLAETNRKLNR